jgi:hypothetical protein
MESADVQFHLLPRLASKDKDRKAEDDDKIKKVEKVKRNKRKGGGNGGQGDKRGKACMKESRGLTKASASTPSSSAVEIIE